MPVVLTNPQFPYQVGASPTSQSFSTQLNYREMLSEVQSWNPNFDPMKSGRAINNAYRSIIDRRMWYGLRVMGQAQVPNITAGGMVTVVNGSTALVGVGTAWTNALIGLQFRTGFTFPFQTIATFVDATHMTLQTPYVGTSGTFAYQIVEAYMTFGGNVKSLLWATNQLQGWPINVSTRVEAINAWDTWRTSLGWARYMAKRPPTPDGQLQVEIWPTPYAQQVFPFEAFTQPPNMEADTDTPVAWIRSDLLVQRAIADAMMFGGRKSDYYDPTTAAAKVKMFNDEVERAEWADDGLDQQSVFWDDGYEMGQPTTGDGSAYSQSHDV
jgi:hypothetical protein